MLKIVNVQKMGNTIKTLFRYDEKWGNYLIEDEIVNTYDVNVEDVPDSIAIIPALCNLLPLAWVFDLEIECGEIDESFNKAIPCILAGYRKMYPDFKFGGTLKVRKTRKNNYSANKTAVLFSGGVDATTTAYRHMDEKPDIVTILGSDIELTDKVGIDTVNRMNSQFAEKYGLSYQKIYSNFRAFINNSVLESVVKKFNSDYSWWHEFQHGIGLIGLVAPLSYMKGYAKVCIASSFHISQWGQYTCASDPVIDNELKYGETITIHDGYEMTRVEKIKYICDFVERDYRKPYLRVCWESGGGRNCCHCEKCRRTYLALLAERVNPSDYGLDFDRNHYLRTVRWCKKHLPYKSYNTIKSRYQPIKEAFMQNYERSEAPEGLGWLWDTEIGAKPFSFLTKIEDKVRRKLDIE